MKSLKLTKETVADLNSVNGGFHWFGTGVCATDNGSACFKCQSFFVNCNVNVNIEPSAICIAFTEDCSDDGYREQQENRQAEE